jgi:hypothetical protein
MLRSHAPLAALSHILLWVTAGFWLLNVGLGHISGRDAEPTEARRRAIAASRLRTKGHLWLLGALISLLVVFALLARPERPAFGHGLTVLIVGFTGAMAFCASRMVKAYRDAGRARHQG